MSNPVAFVLGFGHNIGSHVARKFKQEGFDVAVASRSLDPEALRARGYLGIRLDLGRVSDIATAFDQVEAVYGPACVVVYNAANATFAPLGPSHPLSMSFDDFSANVRLSGLNAFEVARRANAGFDKLPPTQSRVFIATGNILPWMSMPHLIGLSAGKRILANIVEACSEAYGPFGKRFYYAQEVSESGGPQSPPDGRTHGQVYYALYLQKSQGLWHVRFKKGGERWAPPRNR